MMESVEDKMVSEDAVAPEIKADTFKMPILVPSFSIKKKSSEVAKAFAENTDSVEKSSSETDRSGSSDVCETADKDNSNVVDNKKQKLAYRGFSPAEMLKENEIVIPYKEPSWGGITDKPYYFEVIKNGAVTERIDLNTKSFHIFGRLPSCDHSMDHPSLSRHHAVIQHCSKQNAEGHDIGWYLFDLDSTHGTWVNKNKVSARKYHRLRVGYIVKFGGSTRLHILQGPESDQDDESELSVSELKMQRERQKKEVEVLRSVEAKELEEFKQRKLRAEQDTGCSWGFGDDAEECDDDDESSTVFPAPLQEELYIDDPKKALRGFFEREGWELPEYEFTDEGRGKHSCRVEVPIDTPSGELVVAEVTQTGSRKDAVVACALEACRILDRHGLLRKATHESRARKGKNWEEADFYDSDEDTFLDRTGDIEKKRQKRISRIKPSDSKAETYESLSAKLEDVNKELGSIDSQIEQDRASKKALEDEGVDALDAFMMSIKSGGMDTKTRMELKRRAVELRQRRTQLERLVALAKPCSLPALVTNHSEDSSAAAKSKSLPLFGKIKTSAIVKPTPKMMTVSSKLRSDDDVVEEEDDDEDDDKKSSATSGPDSDRLQTDADHSADVEQKLSTNQRPSGKRRPEVPNGTTSHKSLKSKHKVADDGSDVQNCSTKYREDDPEYAVWVPPSDQKGDGRTHLNEKFGY